MISTSIYRRLLTSRWTSFTQPKIKPLYRNFAVSASDTALTIHGTPFPFGWLRDSCQCPSCINPSTYHKLHKTSDIPVNIKPKSQGIRATNEGVHIEWITGHQSFYPTPFLERHSSPEKLSRAHQEVRQIAWDSSSLSKAQSLYLPYESLQSPSGLLVAINQLTQFGLLFVTGVPNEESSDATCELRKLAQLFGEIRSTFYGEMFDVKNLRNSTNVAYTNLNLGFHMDLLYFEHPPRFQILHCLRNRVLGGTSMFVDALQAASILRTTNIDAFNTLTSTPVAFHHIHAGHHLHYSHPTIELASPLRTSTYEGSSQDLPISYINYSPPFQAPLSLSVSPETFYPALSEFASLLARPENTFQYLLKEGDAVLFDNRRVLHSRAAFVDKEEVEEGQTNRLLKGCYLEADAVLDRGRVLRAKAEQGLL